MNALLKDYAETHGMVWVDFYTAMKNGEGGLKQEYTYDGVHPNREGYRVMSEILEKYLDLL